MNPNAMSQPALKRLPTRLQAFLFLRYTLVVATAYLLLVEGHFAIPPLGVSLVIAAALGSNLIAGRLPRRLLDSASFGAAVIVADTAWVSGVLLYSGHFSADFFYLYFFVLLLAAIGESVGLIAIGAVVVCVAYMYVLSATGATWSLWNSPSVIRIPFLFSTAAFYGYMVECTRREQQRAAAAERAAQVREDFFASVSHEIRTPVNGLIGWTELLLDTPLDGEQREYAERLSRSGKLLVAIVDDVLDSAKIAAGKIELEAAPLDLGGLVLDLTEQLAESAQRKGLELTGRVDPTVPGTVRGDGVRLGQVLTNLVGNAIKFTSTGEVSIRVMLADETDTDVLVRFEVGDTGIGIPLERQADIFERFVQAESSTTRRFGGSGLGLAIARQLATLMGGQIGVTSRPAFGSTFWFTARLGRVPSQPTQQPAPMRELDGRRTLMVSDCVNMSELVGEQLRAWGVHYDAAIDAAGALGRLRAAAASSAPYDVAIIDVRSSHADGLDLAQAIRATPVLKSLGLVLLVPVVQRDHVNATQPPGPTVAVAKPLRPMVLYWSLVHLMVTGGAQRPLRPQSVEAVPFHDSERQDRRPPSATSSGSASYRGIG